MKEMREGARFAAIDIGSNAARLLLAMVFDQDESRVVRKSSLVRMPVRLGSDTFLTGRISETKARQLVHTMKGFKHLIKAYEPLRVMACATSAMRDAENGVELRDEIFDKTGISIEIIDGRKEAEILMESGSRELAEQSRNVLFVDVGGGSTEITLLSGGRVVSSRSFNIGSIRLANDLVTDGDWRKMEDWIRENASGLERLTSVGSGGNIKSLFKLSDARPGNPIPLSEIRNVASHVETFALEERVTKLGLKPDRADVILPAARIYTSVMEWAKAVEMHVPRLGLADGMVRVLHKRYSEEKSPEVRKQSGVLAYRITEGAPEVLLVSTRSGKHWTIPKGNVKIRLGERQSAEAEGWEEAGVRGTSVEPAIGRYRFVKHQAPVSVKVYLLKVAEFAESFPEKRFRTRKWVSLEEATAMVRHDGLRVLLAGLDQSLMNPRGN